MNSRKHSCKTLLALTLALSLTSCGVPMTEGEKWLDSQKDAPEMNIAGMWVSPEWGKANFKQEKRDVSGVLGDYPVRGVVSGNNLYLLMYAGDKVDYSAKLKASDENTFQGSYAKYSIIDQPGSGSDSIRPINLRRASKDVPPGDTGAVGSQALQEGKSTQERVAAIPKKAPEVKFVRITLRERPEQNFYENDLFKMIKDRNFFSKSYNPSGDFPNDFVDNGDGTVTDRVTKLMWQKEGASPEAFFGAALEYVQELNAKKFGGYTDWRLPTIEELCSLLEPIQTEMGQHIDTVFAGSIYDSWSSDRLTRYGFRYAHVAYFGKGDVDISGVENASGANRGQQRHSARAVRTMK